MTWQCDSNSVFAAVFLGFGTEGTFWFVSFSSFQARRAYFASLWHGSSFVVLKMEQTIDSTNAKACLALMCAWCIGEEKKLVPGGEILFTYSWIFAESINFGTSTVLMPVRTLLVQLMGFSKFCTCISWSIKWVIRTVLLTSMPKYILTHCLSLVRPYF